MFRQQAVFSANNYCLTMYTTLFRCHLFKILVLIKSGGGSIPLKAASDEL